MRNVMVLLAATSLAACGGGSEGPEPIGGVAPPTVGNPSGGNTDIYSQFLNPTDEREYAGVGAYQIFEYRTDERDCCGQQSQIYSPGLSTVRNNTISLSYDPRDAVFTLTVEDGRSGAATGTKFQDPANRTDFGGATEPQWGVNDFGTNPDGTPGNSNVRFLQAGDGDNRSPYSYSGTGAIDPGDNDTPANGIPDATYAATNLFYEAPGSSTRYVGFAGFVRNSITFVREQLLDERGEPVLDSDGRAITVRVNNWHLERGAFAYGLLTANSAVPTSGSATFRGNMLGSVVFNPEFDNNRDAPTYFQWMTGTAEHRVDFGTLQVQSAFTGQLYAPQVDRYTSGVGGLPAGSRFEGSATSQIDLVRTGGFTGQFGSASFTRPDGSRYNVNVAGSTVQGGFYGPAAEEIGGGFRVVGGTADERVDVVGGFTGRR